MHVSPLEAVHDETSVQKFAVNHVQLAGSILHRRTSWERALEWGHDLMALRISDHGLALAGRKQTALAVGASKHIETPRAKQGQIIVQK